MTFPENPFDEYSKYDEYDEYTDHADAFADDTETENPVSADGRYAVLTAPSSQRLRLASDGRLNDRLRDRMRDRIGDYSEDEDDEPVGLSPAYRRILMIVTIIVVIAMIAMTVLPALQAARYNSIRETLPPPTTLPRVWDGWDGSSYPLI